MPEVVESATINSMYEGVAGLVDFGAIYGGCNVLFYIPKFISHDKRDSTSCNVIRLVKPYFALSCMSVSNMPPAIILVSIVEYGIRWGDDCFSTVC